MKPLLPGVGVLLGGLVITAALFAVSLVSSGSRAVGPLTDIQGVPYPISNTKTQVYDSLAHTDIGLIEPTLAKEASITVTFIPHDTKHLSLGVRRSGFWLSYELEPLYDFAPGSDGTTPITRQLHIPLTDKFQDQDRSLDLMFFAANERPIDPITLVASPAYWELQDLQVTVANARPTPFELINYVSSILLRERAL